jgi:hypothetical protein
MIDASETRNYIYKMEKKKTRKIMLNDHSDSRSKKKKKKLTDLFLRPVIFCIKPYV